MTCITKVALNKLGTEKEWSSWLQIRPSQVHNSMAKNWFEVLAIAFLLGLSIVLMTIFNNAVIGGGSTVVDINQYGEMIPELLLLHLIVWPIITVGLYQWHCRWELWSFGDVVAFAVNSLKSTAGSHSWTQLSVNMYHQHLYSVSQTIYTQMVPLFVLFSTNATLYELKRQMVEVKQGEITLLQQTEAKSVEVDTSSYFPFVSI